MISKNKIKEILENTLSTGGDYGELFFEDTKKETYLLNNGEVSSINSGTVHGCGIRIFKKDKCVYGYTNDTSFNSLMNLASSLKDSFEGEKEHEVQPLKVQKGQGLNNPKVEYSSVDINKQLDLLKEAYKAAKEVDEKIVKVDIRYLITDQHVEIYNTDGKICKDRRLRGRAYISCIASDGQKMQVNSVGPGAQKGFDFFTDEIDVKALAVKEAKTALVMLDAQDCPSGEMTVVIDNGFGGVIFHEACGHGLEASSVSKSLSVFSGKKGTKVGSDILNAYDDGTIDGAWGSSNFDDEGNKTQCNQLIKNGVLTSYLVDNFNGRAMGEKGNGACRRESYKFEPTSRMSNTFIGNGTSTKEEIIASTKYGLYAASLGGGSVNPTTGDFNFAVNEGYLIEDGKITKPVRGATLIGNGASVLFNIDMIASNLRREQGMCGASSGSIPADVGQPTIRVSRMTVGGTGGSK